MDLWEQFGFRENPYGTTPIPGDAEGERLLVGRDTEQRRLARRITSGATHPTMEGQNGVGKTSLVAVTAYGLAQDFREGSTRQLLLPVGRTFQLDSSSTASDFIREVFFEVCQTIITHHELLNSWGRDRLPSLDSVRTWLNSPVVTSRGGGASLAGFGASVTEGNVANTSAGFNDSGFRTTVRAWLNELFPTRRDGGFVCVIDNLELLETSTAALALLESLRDELLAQPGLRWVLCGARGIVRGVASSSRLQGVLADPIDLAPIPDEAIADVIARRVEVFGSDESYLPVPPAAFRHLYDVTNHNLRSALKFADDFSLWVADQDPLPESDEDKAHLLEAWMAESADRYEESTSGVTPKGWEVFDQLTGMGGTISPGDFDLFGFKSQQAMRPYVRALEESQLVQTARNDRDNRRKTIEVSARGWIVRYKRLGYTLPSK